MPRADRACSDDTSARIVRWWSVVVLTALAVSACSSGTSVHTANRSVSTNSPQVAISQPSTTSTPCASNLASELAWTGPAHQLVTVEASGYDTDTAAVTLWQLSGGCWSPVGGPWSGFIGYNGFSDHKREGDGTTPTGGYSFGSVAYGNQPDPGFNGSYHQLACGDWWDSDSASVFYNTFQHVPCGMTPAWSKGSEALWTMTRAYASFAVIDYNGGPVTPGAGSAIFLHASTGTATAGCVSIPLPNLDSFLRWLRLNESPLIVMGPTSEITRF